MVRLCVLTLWLTGNLSTVNWDHLHPPMTLKDKLVYLMDGWINETKEVY